GFNSGHRYSDHRYIAKLTNQVEVIQSPEEINFTGRPVLQGRVTPGMRTVFQDGNGFIAIVNAFVRKIPEIVKGNVISTCDDLVHSAGGEIACHAAGLLIQHV